MPDPYFEGLLGNAREAEARRSDERQAALDATRLAQERESMERQLTLSLARSIGAQLTQRAVTYDHRLSGIEYTWKRWPRSRVDSAIRPITAGWLVDIGKDSVDEGQGATTLGVLLDQDGLRHFSGPNSVYSTPQHTVINGMPEVTRVDSLQKVQELIDGPAIHQDLANLAFKYGITDL